MTVRLRVRAMAMSHLDHYHEDAEVMFAGDDAEMQVQTMVPTTIVARRTTRRRTMNMMLILMKLMTLMLTMTKMVVMAMVMDGDGDGDADGDGESDAMGFARNALAASWQAAD